VDLLRPRRATAAAGRRHGDGVLAPEPPPHNPVHHRGRRGHGQPDWSRPRRRHPSGHGLAALRRRRAGPGCLDRHRAVARRRRAPRRRLPTPPPGVGRRRRRRGSSHCCSCASSACSGSSPSAGS
jgi:hypothetical protein